MESLVSAIYDISDDSDGGCGGSNDASSVLANSRPAEAKLSCKKVDTVSLNPATASKEDNSNVHPGEDGTAKKTLCKRKAKLASAAFKPALVSSALFNSSGSDDDENEKQVATSTVFSGRSLMDILPAPKRVCHGQMNLQVAASKANQFSISPADVSSVSTLLKNINSSVLMLPSAVALRSKQMSQKKPKNIEKSPPAQGAEKVAEIDANNITVVEPAEDTKCVEESNHVELFTFATNSTTRNTKFESQAQFIPTLENLHQDRTSADVSFGKDSNFNAEYVQKTNSESHLAIDDSFDHYDPSIEPVELSRDDATSKRKKRLGNIDRMNEHELKAAGFSIKTVNVRKELESQDISKYVEQASTQAIHNAPIRQHLSASTKLSILNLAKKAATQSDDLEKMFSSNRAKKKQAANRYGF